MANQQLVNDDNANDDDENANEPVQVGNNFDNNFVTTPCEIYVQDRILDEDEYDGWTRPIPD